MTNPDDAKLAGSGYDDDADPVTSSVADVDDVPELRNVQTENSRWIQGTAGRNHVTVGLPVVGLDGERIGLVQEVHDTYLLVDRDGRGDIRVPYGAVLDVTGNRVQLNGPFDQAV